MGIATANGLDIDASGNITTDGTVNGRDLSADGALLDARLPTTDEIAAIQGAASPNGTNVFATMDDIGGTPATVREISDAAYTLLDSDSMQWLRFTHASGCTITIPATLPAAFECICEGTDDALDFTGSAVAAATLESYSSHGSSAGAGAVCGLKCTSNSDGSSAVVTLFGRTDV